MKRLPKNWEQVPLVLDPPWVAAFLAVNPATVRKYCRNGIIKAKKTCPGKRGEWRITKDALREYMEGQTANVR